MLASRFHAVSALLSLAICLGSTMPVSAQGTGKKTPTPSLTPSLTPSSPSYQQLQQQLQKDRQFLQQQETWFAQMQREQLYQQQMMMHFWYQRQMLQQQLMQQRLMQQYSPAVPATGTAKNTPATPVRRSR